MPQTQEEHLIALEDEKEDSDSEHSTPAGPDVEVITSVHLYGPILYITHVYNIAFSPNTFRHDIGRPDFSIPTFRYFP